MLGNPLSAATGLVVITAMAAGSVAQGWLRTGWQTVLCGSGANIWLRFGTGG